MSMISEVVPLQKSNFDFLTKKWSMLADLGKLAEKNIYEDSNTTLIKLGMFAELLVQYIYAYENLTEPEENKQATKIKILKQYDLVLLIEEANLVDLPSICSSLFNFHFFIDFLNKSNNTVG